MQQRIFCGEGHISNWVFYPPAWNSEEPWQSGFTSAELENIFDHMKGCHECRKNEIEATLRWAELCPRVATTELTKSFSMYDSANESFNLLPFDKYSIYLLKHILEYTKGQLINLFRDDSGRVIKITGKTKGNIESGCTFIYEGSTTVIHCYSSKKSEALSRLCQNFT